MSFKTWIESAKIHFEKDRQTSEIEDPINIVESIEERELSETISKTIESLPERCGIIFSMKRYGDYTNKQISEELNISEKTVENQITIAFRKLRPILSKYFYILAAFNFS